MKTSLVPEIANVASANDFAKLKIFQSVRAYGKYEIIGPNVTHGVRMGSHREAPLLFFNKFAPISIVLVHE